MVRRSADPLDPVAVEQEWLQQERKRGAMISEMKDSMQ